MGPTVKVRDVDRGWKKLKDFAKRVGDGKTYVKVGIVGPKAQETNEEGITTVRLAMIHEFGAPSVGIPERSFLRVTFDRNRVAYRAMLRKLLVSVFSTKPLMKETQALGILGAKIAADVKGYVTQGAGVPPPNSPATLARKLAKTRPGSKGQPRTLIDTGRMIGSITWIVVSGGKKG